MGYYEPEEVFIDLGFVVEDTTRLVRKQVLEARKAKRAAAAEAKRAIAFSAKAAAAAGLKVVVSSTTTEETALAPKAKGKRKGKTAMPKGVRRAVKVAKRHRRCAAAAACRNRAIVRKQAWEALVNGAAVGAAGANFGKEAHIVAEATAVMKIAEKKIFDKSAREFFAGCGLPEKTANLIGKSGYSGKVLSDWDMIDGGLNPLEIFEAAIAKAAQSAQPGKKKKPSIKVDPSVGDGFRKWASAYGLVVVEDETDEDRLFDHSWFNLVDLSDDNVVRAKLETLLRHTPATLAVKGTTGVYQLHGVEFDLNRVRINRKKSKHSVLVMPGGNQARLISPLASMYFVVSGALAGVKTSGKDPRSVFDGYVNVMYSRSTDALVTEEQDPATQAMFKAKPPVFELDFAPHGFVLREYGDGERKANVYKAIAKAIPTLTAHYQGKYFYDITTSALGIEVDMQTGEVYLVSRSLAKAWKRHTIGVHNQIRMVNPDVGYFRNKNGAEHYGRRVPIFLTRNGLNIPYLGNVPSLLGNSDLAKILRTLTETTHRFSWAGNLCEQLTLPEEGSFVTKNQTLVQGAPEPTPAGQDGTVSIVEPLTFKNGMTTLAIRVSVLDTEGEAKLRSQLLKGQPSTVGLICPDWVRIANALGLGEPQASHGDFAILDGLLYGDAQPVLVYTEDAAKMWGPSSNASAAVALAAETLQEPLVYSPKDHFEKKYKSLVDKFLNLQHRKLRLAYAVTPDMVTFIAKANRPDVQILEVDGLNIIVQTVEGWLAHDLVKVESSSVADAVSKGRFPLEVAVFARVLGMPNYAEEILAGGDDAFQSVVALQNSIVLRREDGSLVLPNGKTLEEAGVIKINVMREPSERMQEVLLKMSADYRKLTRKVLFTVEKDDKLFSWVLIDPVVLKALGGAKDRKETLVSFFCQLCTATAQQTTVRESLVKRLAGKVKALADSSKSSKRVNRGSEVVYCKTVAAATPDGYVALSYYGVVAKMLARMAGFTKLDYVRSTRFVKVKPCSTVKSGVRKRIYTRKPSNWVIRVVADVYRFAMSGPVGTVTRAPQTAPLPVRYWFPDAPKAVWDKMVSHKVTFVAGDKSVTHALVPVGSKRSEDRLESHRVYMSPRDSAWCHGDHDGDLRQFHVARETASKVELLGFDVETHRLDTLAVYQQTPVDPVVEAFELNKKKSVMALDAVKISLVDFHAQNEKTIRHQTEILGTAYNFAHMALSRADLVVASRLSATVCHSAWVGGYEVNLGGAEEEQINLFDMLQGNPFRTEDGQPDTERWREAVIDLAAEAGWTEYKAKLLMTLNVDVKCYKALERGKPLTLSGDKAVRAVQGGVFRYLSRGVIQNGKLNDLIVAVGTGATVSYGEENVARILDKIRENAVAGSVSARIVVRFFDEVYPLMAARFRQSATEGENPYEEV